MIRWREFQDYGIKGMSKILVELNLCSSCSECEARCSYPYHLLNQGFEALREKLAREVFCRRCEQRFCEKACPKSALEKGEDGLIRRNVFRCISCYSCVLACPFGVLEKSYLVYHSNICDLCKEREAECVKSCPEGAIKVVKEEELEGAKESIKGVLVKGWHWEQSEKRK